ncbi:MAG TPA: hypothetical protein VFR06_01520 [Gallionellaceae bacterium]|nr:hypothetical protein [Gallionellaceae bacterium]
MLRLFGSGSDHPLSSLKSAQQLLEGLPKNDAVEVLQEIGHWIEELFEPANGFRLDHQLGMLRLLDEAAHPFLRRVTHSYFAVVPPAAFQENRLWGAMSAYYAYTALAYLHLLAGVRNGDKGSAALKSSLPLICARGIYAISGRLECAAVRYLPMEQQLWQHLAEFYSLAEEVQCQDELLVVYHGSGGQSTVNRQFAAVLMWHTSSVGTFRPLDLHISRRLIMHMSKSFSVASNSSGSLFCFDLTQPSPPVRVKEEGTMYPESVRFVGVGGAPTLFEDMLKTLAKNLVPEELQLGVAYSPEAVSDVAHRLSLCCQAPLPTRRNQRHKIKVSMNVASGFLRMVDYTSVDLYLDNEPCEMWEMEDISTTGFSCVMPAARVPQIKIGALIGLQPDKVNHWGAGVVRRLSRDVHNNLHIGIELLASKVHGVKLRINEGMNAGATQQALLLDKPDARDGEGWLVMQPDSYSSSRSPTLLQDENEFLMLPLGLVEKGEDFDLAHYRKMKQDRAEEAR